MANIVVNVEQGALRGKKSTNRKGGEYYSFLGVPYAKPPVGNLRFKDPQPAEKWEGVRDATQDGSPCFSLNAEFDAQKGFTLKQVGSEDCLFLNIHTKELPQGKKPNLKPVMVFIHGGGFTMGSNSSDAYGSEKLMCEDIVLILINYRLGPLGFLCLEDSSLGVTGNAGLKDMVEALKWVQRNVGNFGGDPNNVTIFGESAGGSAVHYLLLSPLTKGLFHKVIPQSGIATNGWAIGSRDSAIRLANALGCKETNEKKILEFLQSVPVQKIQEGQTALGDFISAGAVRPFGPVIEKPSPTALISEDPHELVRSGKYNQVPVMVGYTSKEGILAKIGEGTNVSFMVTEPGHVIPHFLKVEKDSELYKQLEEKVLKFYLNGKEPSQDEEGCILLAGDNYFGRETRFFVKSHVKNSNQPIYFYVFSMETSLNIYRKIAKIDFPGVCHGEDLVYLFNTNFVTSDIVPGSVEDQCVDKLVKLWTNFAATGNPVSDTQGVLKGVKWEPASRDKLNYLDLGIEPKMDVNPDEDRMKFWDEIFKSVCTRNMK